MQSGDFSKHFFLSAKEHAEAIVVLSMIKLSLSFELTQFSTLRIQNRIRACFTDFEPTLSTSAEMYKRKF